MFSFLPRSSYNPYQVIDMMQTDMSQTVKLTIELPEPIARQLQAMAALTEQTLEELVAQSITGNLPPEVDTMPGEMQPELLAMQKLSINELLEIANSQVSSDAQNQHLDLLEKGQNSTLTPAERQTLTNLRQAADQLMLRKAYAWKVLRWRGRRVPTLQELPLK